MHVIENFRGLIMYHKVAVVLCGKHSIYGKIINDSTNKMQ